MNLAHCYEVGSGVIKDIKRANQLYINAAEKGAITSYYYLGISYYNGSGIAETVDYHKAVKYLDAYVVNMRDFTSISDDSKAVISDALQKLSSCYRFGRGTISSEKKADELLQEAVDYGVPDADAIARVLEWMNQ